MGNINLGMGYQKYLGAKRNVRTIIFHIEGF